MCKWLESHIEKGTVLLTFLTLFLTNNLLFFSILRRQLSDFQVNPKLQYIYMQAFSQKGVRVSCGCPILGETDENCKFMRGHASRMPTFQIHAKSQTTCSNIWYITLLPMYIITGRLSLLVHIIDLDLLVVFRRSTVPCQHWILSGAPCWRNTVCYSKRGRYHGPGMRCNLYPLWCAFVC